MMNEKSVSRSQQRLMGQVYGVRKWYDSHGKEGLNPKDIEGEYREKIVKMAKDWDKKKDLKDYASTKHKGLPEIKEENSKEVPTIFPYLNPEANTPKKRTKYSKMQNISDYREFINKKK